MKILLIDNEDKKISDYMDAVRSVDEAASVRGFMVADAYKEIVSREIENLSFPILVERKRIHVRTFGNFEVYIDGIPVSSKYNKTRELFAFLIDKNGSLTDTKEIAAALWEGDTADHTSYLKNIRSDMLSTLKEWGEEDVVVRQRGRLGIIPDMIQCDYFDMLAGNESAMIKYTGEYMSQYSWAEYTNGALADIKDAYMKRKGL